MLPEISSRNVAAYILAGQDWSHFQKCKIIVCFASRVNHSPIWTYRMGWGSVLSQLSGGPKFRKHRRITQETLGARYMDKYVPLQRRATSTFLADLGDTPTNFADHIKR